MPGHEVGRLGASSGVVPPPMYPLDNPRAAIQNALRARGLYGNMFNPAYDERVNELALSAPAQFYLQMLGQPGVSNMDESFGEFLSGLLSGAIAPLSVGGAQQGLQGLQRAMQRTNQMAMGAAQPNEDVTDPSVFASVLERLMLQGALSPIEAAIAGRHRDPKAQMSTALGAFLPSLGPALTGGLGNVYSRQADLFSGFLGPQAAMSPNWQMLSLLDLLLGNAQPWYQNSRGPQGYGQDISPQSVFGR